MKYIVYARKSSESEDRQAQSIEDQLKEIRNVATARGLNVVKELTEAKSAKAPGGRPVFSELISEIQSGKADAILCWHVNRLFRNPVDSGAVSWLLQTGQLKEICTPHQVYRSGDNVLLLSVESGMANQYILDLRKAVCRGMKSKVEKGIPPQVAPDGYVNNVRLRTIEADPDHFSIIRAGWDLMLTGVYSVPQIVEILNTTYAYKSLDRRTLRGKPLSRVTGYRIFHNVFYTGSFLYDGRMYQGTYPAMVTWEEFEKVQTIIGRQQGGRVHRKTHSYTGLVRCARCGCAITAEVQKGNTYYHCSNAKKICDKRGVTENVIDGAISNLLSKIQFKPEVEDLFNVVIERCIRTPTVDTSKQLEIIRKELRQSESEGDELILMRAKHLIDDEGLVRAQKKLLDEAVKLKGSLAAITDETASKPENAVRAVEFCVQAKERFNKADPWKRRMIAQNIGSAYMLNGKVFTFTKHPVLRFVCENKETIELAINSYRSHQLAGFSSTVSVGGPDSTVYELFRLCNQFPLELPCLDGKEGIWNVPTV